MSNKEFLFSVVMPIYNTEDYLEEAIDSIVAQTLGFEEYIQLVLVDDGSTDGSGAICRSYADRYPDNIVYAPKKNGGVSSACNFGLEIAAGAYVNFFGSDDRWAPETFAAVRDFLKKHKDDVDVVCCKVMLFGRQEGDHPLNFKYERDAVIDLIRRPDYVQCADGNCFFRRAAIGGRRFDEKLSNAEDALFLNDILLDKCAYGVVKDGYYAYRKRSGALTSVKSKRKRFTVEPTRFAKRLFDLSRERYGEVLPFIAWTVMYEMQWRLSEQPTDDITSDEVKEYDRILRELLVDISDKCIREQTVLTLPMRAYAMRMKHGTDFFKHVTWNKGRAYYDHTTLLGLNGRTLCKFHVLDLDGDVMVIKGHAEYSSLGLDFELFARDNKGNEFRPEIVRMPSLDVLAFNGDHIVYGEEFIFRLPVADALAYKFFVRLDGKTTIRIKQPAFEWFAHVDNLCEENYWARGGFIFKWRKAELQVYAYRKKSHIAAELRYMREILRYNPNGNVEKSERRRAVRLRLAYYIAGIFLKRKTIWLVSDRNEHATDNGASFFEYATRHLDGVSVKPYFVLCKSSVDYPELRKYGKVVEPESLKYYMLFLWADKVISAHYDHPIILPFKGQTHFFSNLPRFDYVYLQHGILQGDLSKLINVTRKNIKLLPTSTNMEMRALLSGGYGYSENEVKMLGMPRFDGLAKYETKKIIAFLPTWRVELAGNIIPGTREREYVDDFKTSDYCLFYNALINDERLTAAMKEHGFTGVFYVHPSFEKQADDFFGNDVVKVHKETASYVKVLGESAILVTDYSGVQFDFAYQRKPLVYSHFDNIYSSSSHHYQNSYFSYVEDGFGPIAKTVDEIVEYLIEMLDSGCQIEPTYKERVDRFFYFNDSDNAKRVFEAVLGMKTNV